MTRKSLASSLAPDMRTLQQLAERELNTGSMTGALMLSYVDLGTTVAVGVRYYQLKNMHDAYTTFGMLVGSLALQAIFTFASGQGVIATAVTLVGGKVCVRHTARTLAHLRTYNPFAPTFSQTTTMLAPDVDSL